MVCLWLEPLTVLNMCACWLSSLFCFCFVLKQMKQVRYFVVMWPYFDEYKLPWCEAIHMTGYNLQGCNSRFLVYCKIVLISWSKAKVPQLWTNLFSPLGSKSLIDYSFFASLSGSTLPTVTWNPKPNLDGREQEIRSSRKSVRNWRSFLRAVYKIKSHCAC